MATLVERRIVVRGKKKNSSNTGEKSRWKNQERENRNARNSRQSVKPGTEVGKGNKFESQGYLRRKE